MVERVENKWNELLEDLRVIRPTVERLKSALADRVAGKANESAKPDDLSGSIPPSLMAEKIQEIARQVGMDVSRIGQSVDPTVGTTDHIHRTAKANFPWTMGSDAAAERIKAYLESVATEKLRGRG